MSTPEVRPPRSPSWSTQSVPTTFVFGSDWPHGEGRGTPLDYVPEFDTLGEAERRLIRRDTTAALLGLDGGGHGYT